jgi:putative CocE/NonD family hydrolase
MTNQTLAAQRLHAVRVLRHQRIPMSDGVELDAHLFLPEADGPFPAVFDYYPYRKDDLSGGNLRYQMYLAQRGYAALRVDVRGTGSSGGVATDEYSVQEQLDGVEAIAWMAAQPWCTGKVGMFGSSYGGFNSLQVAMHRPPALKAICPMYFTDNRYTDDCHYKGGTLQMLYDVATYGLSMVVQNALPPYPDATGDRWAAIWAEHLEAEPWLLTWLSNQVYGDYWKQGSLCEDYGSIECAAYLIGGWRDGYTNCNLRTYQHLRSPKKVIVGPWLHVAPDAGLPGPRIDHLHEMVRFYDYWLKGIDNGIMDEPSISIYVQHFDTPAAERKLTSGEWRFEREWPLPTPAVRQFYLGEAMTLQDAPPAAEQAVDYEYNPTVGTTFGMFSAGSPLVTPVDQRLEDAYSTSWTSPPLEEALEILGHPHAALFCAVTAEVASLSVRLIDVAPDGTAALVTKGVLNLTHRDSHTAPQPLTPDQVYAVEIKMDATCWHFAPGHRIRLGVAAADFPNSWPSPIPHTGRLLYGGEQTAHLSLPVLPPQAERVEGPEFRPPAPQSPQTTSYSDKPIWSVTRDHIAGTASVRVGTSGRSRISDTVELARMADATATVSEADPAHATIRGVNRVTLHWPERTIESTARAQVESNAVTFQVTIQLAITMDGLPYHSRQWTRSIPRHLV